MKIFLKRLSITLSIIIVFSTIFNLYSVSASPLLEGPSSNGLNWFDWSVEALKEVGLIFDPSVLHPTPLEMAQAINNNDSNANVDATDESINEYINNNTTYNNDNSKTYNNNTRFILNYLSNYYKEQSSMYYVYSYDLLELLDVFNDGTYFSDVRREVTNNQRDYYIFYSYGSYNNRPTLLFFEKSKLLLGLYISNEFNSITNENIYLYNDTWEYAQPDIVKYYDVNRSWVSVNDFSALNNNNRIIVCNELNGYYNINSSSNGLRFCFIANNGYNTLRCYKDFASLKDGSIGIQPYYVNTDVYSNWSNSSGDYNVTTDNSNKISYGDVNTYINNYYDSNGEYPDPTNINIYINNNIPGVTPTPTPNPDNPSGGGTSGSATATANNSGVNVTVNNNHQITLGLPWTVSGNGSGNSNGSGGSVSGNGSSGGGIGNIFDFLGYIGDIIGDLISGIGKAFVGILEGVSEAVQVVTEGIPNVLAPLIGFIFEGLPEEITSLMTLGITAVLLIAIVKAIRK